jgi:hypothetical protein
MHHEAPTGEAAVRVAFACFVLSYRRRARPGRLAGDAAVGSAADTEANIAVVARQHAPGLREGVARQRRHASADWARDLDAGFGGRRAAGQQSDRDADAVWRGRLQADWEQRRGHRDQALGG